MDQNDGPEFTRYGRENRMKKGKTFFKGRFKQISKDKNPSQWSSYNKAPRIKHLVNHHNPLAQQLTQTRQTGILSTKSLPPIANNNYLGDDNDDDNDNDQKDVNQSFLNASDTQKILQLSKNQIDDNKDQQFQKPITSITQNTNKSNKLPKNEQLFQIKSSAISLQDILGNNDDDNDDNKSVSSISQTANDVSTIQDIKLTPNEEAEIEMFMPRSTKEQTTLHDIIMKRVSSVEYDNISQLNANKIIERKIPKKVIAVYIDVGNILSKWRSGKLPKAFKIIPQLEDWEEILYITNPDKWTPHVVYQSIKLFSSSANQSICQRFYNTILLTRVRDDILLNKKLNFHLYQAVRRSLFKSQAFFRGFLLPICCDELRAREAIIIGSVLSRNSIPVIQSALAIFKILEMEYSGPVHYILKILLNKRYSLPLKVLNALVLHFKKFENDSRQMTVIWHQTFLIFVEIYKKSLTKKQRYSLKNVLKKQFHHQITPIIRKELYQNVIEKISSMDIDI